MILALGSALRPDATAIVTSTIQNDHPPRCRPYREGTGMRRQGGQGGPKSGAAAGPSLPGYFLRRHCCGGRASPPLAEKKRVVATGR